VHLSTSRLRLIFAVVLIALVAGITPGARGAGVRPQASPPLSLSCEACIVVDDLGRVLWARSATTQFPNASTTKMVTALVTVASAELDETTTVSAAAGSVGGGGLDLQAGDQMQVDDLLVSMLLSSSNEAAATLAEHVGGTQEAFVADMNVTARRLGARDTHFENPHGLDTTGHYSTAEDLALIGRAVLEDPVLAEIVGTSRDTVDTPRGPVTEQNRNVLLEGYDGAIGIKTGRTLGAGNVLVAAARRGNRTLIAVAMRSADAAADARTLLDAGFRIAHRLDRPRSTTLLEEGTMVGTMVYDPGGSVAVVAAETVTLDLPPQSPPVTFRFLPRRLTPPLEEGQHLGRVEVMADGQTLATVPIVVADEVRDTPGVAVSNMLGTLISWVAGAVSVVT
jgi:D-alanyl-D-alanine carboxypeptidase (penicillin-binding protein 5/6)